jgi:hypothetical protein
VSLMDGGPHWARDEPYWGIRECQLTETFGWAKTKSCHGHPTNNVDPPLDSSPTRYTLYNYIRKVHMTLLKLKKFQFYLSNF